MSDTPFTKEQKAKLKQYMRLFLEYAKSNRYVEDRDDRDRRVSYFREDLPPKISELSEVELLEIVNLLWSNRGWSNKQYVVQKLIVDNGIESLRQEMRRLLDTSEPAGKRYSRFLDRVKNWGPAATTEMLCYNEPDKCGIWNDKARKALQLLGLDNYVSPRKYRLSPDEYEKFNTLLKTLAKELSQAGVKDVDLLIVDFFLYEATQAKPIGAPPPEPVTTFDHDELQDMVKDIGVMLGFDADTEVSVARGAKVDVVWSTRIGNLGSVEYVFEIHKAGSIDSLILNLQKANSNPAVHKVIAVSDAAQLEKIRGEAQGLPAEFREALVFWKVSEVAEVSEHLSSATEVIGRLGLGHRAK